jgi:hypothetical protein
VADPGVLLSKIVNIQLDKNLVLDVLSGPLPLPAWGITQTQQPTDNPHTSTIVPNGVLPGSNVRFRLRLTQPIFEKDNPMKTFTTGPSLYSRCLFWPVNQNVLAKT